MNDAEKQVYEKTIEMFGGACAICGSNKIECHHIRFGACGRHTYMGNVIPLCKFHHQAVHKNARAWTPELIKIINERMRECGIN